MRSGSICRRLVRVGGASVGALAFAIMAMAASSPGATEGSRKTLLIAYANALESAAKQWSDYRVSPAGGEWSVVLHAVQPAVEGDKQRESLREVIRQRYRERFPQKKAGDADFAVLLLGDADVNGIATWNFPQRDPVLQGHNDNGEYVSDHPYQVLNDKAAAPDFALGRVPARDVEEALALLNKIKHAEQIPAGGFGDGGHGRNKVVYAAGEGRFGVMDDLLESLFKTMVDQMVPDAFDLSMTYAKSSSIYCPPPSKLTDTVLARMSEGAVLFNYLGHGFAHGFDALHWNGKRVPILQTPHLMKLPQEPVGGQRPIAFLSCCSAGWYDLPNGRPSVAEAMLFHPSGPVAVIAGSRITHPYANTILQKDITSALLKDRAPTVGVLDLRAMQSLVKIDETDRELDAIALPIAIANKWKTDLMGLRRMHVQLYNLLGDPAMRIGLPAHDVDELAVNDGTVTGRVHGMRAGRVFITAETARTSFAHQAKLMAIVGENDPELEVKAANNYPLVNDRVLARFEGEVKDGGFAIRMPNGLPDEAFMLRAYAAGVDAEGNAIDGMGALRLPPPVDGARSVNDAQQAQP